MSVNLGENGKVISAFLLGSVAATALYQIVRMGHPSKAISNDEDSVCPEQSCENSQLMEPVESHAIVPTSKEDVEKNPYEHYSLDSSNASYVFQSSSAKGFNLNKWIESNQRLINLYEDFIHFQPIRNSWRKEQTADMLAYSSTITPANMHMDSDLRAIFQAMETIYVLLSQFIVDEREYSTKELRIESLTKDLAVQCQLLIRMHNEFKHVWRKYKYDASKHRNTNSKKKSDEIVIKSAGLKLIADQIKGYFNTLSIEHQETVRNMMLSIYVSMHSLSISYLMNIGIEKQLNELIVLVGLEALYDDSFQWAHSYRETLDYADVVESHLISNTLYQEHYEHPEDLFFRTIHVGTECWGKVATSYLAKATASAHQFQWKEAAYSAVIVSDILNYLGNHILCLTSMNLRDYLIYKVEIIGISGEGSITIKSFRQTVQQLFEPLKAYIVHQLSTANEVLSGIPLLQLPDYMCSRMNKYELLLFNLLSNIYTHPEHSKEYGDIYQFCKSLELCEAALLSGFYHKHYTLACCVIGTLAKGTLASGVGVLKQSVKTGCFPMLDQIRYSIAGPIDTKYCYNRGKIVNTYALKRKMPLVR